MGRPVAPGRRARGPGPAAGLRTGGWNDGFAGKDQGEKEPQGRASKEGAHAGACGGGSASVAVIQTSSCWPSLAWLRGSGPEACSVGEREREKGVSRVL